MLYKIKSVYYRTIKGILGMLVVRKKGGKLHFIDFGGHADRNDLMKKILTDSLHAVKDFPMVIINTSDRPVNRFLKTNVFSFSTRNGYFDKIIPDWTYESWKICKIPEFDVIVKEIEGAGCLSPKVNKIGWIGNFETSPSRLILAQLGDKYPEYLDIKDSNNTEYMSLPDLVKNYGFLVDVEGIGFSGRLKYLFFSGRPVFVQERQLQEYPLIRAVPYKDYIPVKNDFSDLIEKFEYLLQNSQKAEKIGKNGKLFAKSKLSKKQAHTFIENQFNGIEQSHFNNIKVFLCIFLIICGKIGMIIRILMKKVIQYFDNK